MVVYKEAKIIPLWSLSNVCLFFFFLCVCLPFLSAVFFFVDLSVCLLFCMTSFLFVCLFSFLSVFFHFDHLSIFSFFHFFSLSSGQHMGKLERIRQFSHLDSPSRNLSFFCFMCFLNKVLSLAVSQLRITLWVSRCFTPLNRAWPWRMSDLVYIWTVHLIA